MEIEKVPKHVWIDVIKGKITAEYEYLALKVLLARLQLNAKRDSSDDAYNKYAEELKSLFLKSVKIPSAQRDIQKIISKGGI